MTSDISPEAQLDIDAGKRLSYTVALHIAGLGDSAYGQWIAVRLADGSTDGNCYPSKRDAVRMQSTPLFYTYVKILPGGITMADATTYLKICRLLRDQGMDLTKDEENVTLGTV